MSSNLRHLPRCGLRSILKKKPIFQMNCTSVIEQVHGRMLRTSSSALAPNLQSSVESISQTSVPFRAEQTVELTNIQIADSSLKMRFSDGSHGEAPFLWLRDNCQCSSCFDSISFGRKFLLMNLNLDAKPKTVECHDNVVTLTWNDGHISTYSASWFHERAFNPHSRKSYSKFHKLEREAWGKGLELDKFNYSDLKSNDKSLLTWLLTLERKGVALVTNTPNDPDAGALLVEHVAFVKNSHYGRRSPVLIRENSNNLAYTNVTLGLHTDLSQYEHQAGIILIQTVEQHKGKGGESVISDGLLCTDLLKKLHPEAFKILSKTNVYFWDKGRANVDLEMEEFYKISKYPVIGLDSENNLDILRMNNQVRDSHLDVPSNEVNSFYEALKRLNDLLYDNSFTFKMNNGEILCLDNERCLHGREGYELGSSRHLESTYLDWDEARCKRRRLQEKLLPSLP